MGLGPGPRVQEPRAGSYSDARSKTAAPAEEKDVSQGSESEAGAWIMSAGLCES